MKNVFYNFEWKLCDAFTKRGLAACFDTFVNQNQPCPIYRVEATNSHKSCKICIYSRPTWDGNDVILSSEVAVTTSCCSSV